ncbi:hypothetical protein ACFLSJ_06760 [Verrucomicrobiota bacterium]
MKTAFELAMERLGDAKSYTDGQKKRLADIDSVYEAKKAEARLGAEERLRAVEERSDEADKIRGELACDLDRLERKREAEKDKVRKDTD